MASSVGSGVANSGPSYVTPKQYGFPYIKQEDITIMNPEEEEAKFLANCAKCHECEEFVPHKLLYVCRYKKCKNFCKPKEIEYEEPSMFYENEKVFCSKCTFTGSHRKHSDYMEEAHPIAIKMASSDDTLKLKFEMMAFLDQEDPVDYSITNDFQVTGLPVLPVEQYLLNAEDSTDWKNRKQEIDALKKTVDQCRSDGCKFAKECAVKAYNTYYKLLDTVNEALENDDDTLETEEPEVKQESAAENNKKAPKQENNPVDEATARMLCRNLNLTFEQVRDTMKIEEALQEVSNMLHASTGTRENKLAAAKMFKEFNNVALYYPPQN